MTHFSMALILYIWTQFQKLLCTLLKALLVHNNYPPNYIYDQIGGDIFLGYFTTSMSAITFWYSFKATASRERFKNTIFRWCDTIVDKMIKICDCSDDENDEISKKAQ